MCLLQFIVLIKQNDQNYYWIRTFLKHQSINRPSKSRNLNVDEIAIFHEPNDTFETANLNSLSTPGILSEHSVSTHVHISYKGKKCNQIDFEKLQENQLKITSFDKYPDPHSDEEYYNFIMKSKKGSICPLCGRKYSMRQEDINDTYPNIDHIIPKSQGGKHNPENLQVICARCNTQKYNTHGVLTDNSLNTPGGLRACSSTKERKGKERNIKEINKEKNDGFNFNEFWEIYPRKQKKPEALQAYTAAFELVGHQLLMRCVKEHQKMKNSDPAFIPQAHNFLEKEPWQDLPREVKAWKQHLVPHPTDPISTEQARNIAEGKNI